MGRGRSGTSGGASGGVNPNNIVSTTSLISERGDKTTEVDDTLAVLRSVSERYGVELNDVQVAVLKGKDTNVLGYYDNGGNLAIGANYFDSAKMDAAYDRCIKSGFHPRRGSKSGMEAVVAHEMGHKLTDVAAQKMGLGNWNLDEAANRIVREAAKTTGKRTQAVRSAISGYASGRNAEAVAEAFADVFCNGNRARRESRAVVDALNKVLGV